MQELVDGLRDAAGEPPPSSIDLDRLIEGEYRRTRVRTGVATVLAAAALAAFVAVPLALTTGGGSTAPPPTDVAAPAPSCRELAQSVPADPGGGDPAVLRDQIAPCLAAMLPGATLTDPATNTPGVRFDGSRGEGFRALVEVENADGTGLLAFTYHLVRPGCEDGTTGPRCDGPSNCPRAESGGTQCLVRDDGTKLLIQQGPVGPALHNQLNVYRPDGSYVQLASTNGNDPHGFISDALTVTATKPPLTSAQLIEIADALRLDR
jgi:hypothetical protein